MKERMKGRKEERKTHTRAKEKDRVCEIEFLSETDIK